MSGVKQVRDHRTQKVTGARRGSNTGEQWKGTEQIHLQFSGAFYLRVKQIQEFTGSHGMWRDWTHWQHPLGYTLHTHEGRSVWEACAHMREDDERHALGWARWVTGNNNKLHVLLMFTRWVRRTQKLIRVVVDCFYIALFSALDQTHSARMWFYMSE